MSAPARLVAFALALALLFGGGVALGAAVGPFDDGAPQPEAPHEVHP